MTEPKVKTIRALERGLDVLAELQQARAASLNDLHRATGLPKATLLRVLLTLRRKGLIWQRLADSAYCPSHQIRLRRPELHDEDYLVEVASPIMASLCADVQWPSVLAVPRLEHMEVIETNRPKSYFHHIVLGPIGFRINFLRSATGRAYLAFCDALERQAIIERLRNSSQAGNYLAQKPNLVANLLQETQTLGYGTRYPDYGGDYNQPRASIDDGRDSIAVPIRVEGEPIAVINLTWIKTVTQKDDVVARYLKRLKQAAKQIAASLAA